MLLEAKGAADVQILIFFNGIELEKKFWNPKPALQ